MRAKGSGPIQQFILAETERWANEFYGKGQNWALTVASLTYRYVNRDVPKGPGRREFTASEYESVRRAARNLYLAGRLGKEEIRYRDGDRSWGYVSTWSDDEADR